MRGAYAVAMLALGGSVTSPAWAAPRVPEGGCAGLQAEQEPNGTAATATPFDLSTINDRFAGIHGTIAVPGDVDWYSFSAPPGARLWLSVDTGVAGPGSRDSVVSIFGPDGMTLIEEDDDDGTGNGRDITIESLEASLVAGRVLSAGGTYYARVRAKIPGATIDGYSLLIAVTTAAPMPEIEPNDVPPCPPASTIVLGSLSSAADVDCYHVAILDNGFPFVVVDGDPERDGIGTDITLRFEGFFPLETIVTDSSRAGDASNPPGEGFAIMNLGTVFITGTGPGTYMFGWWFTGECPVPVDLQAFEIE